MGRLIDADELLKHKYHDSNRYENAVACYYICNAPTIDVPSWIPCSERLPNNDEEVIVSVEDDRADNTFKYTTTAWRYGDVWVSDNERICGIIAWMPLPKPYKESE